MTAVGPKTDFAGTSGPGAKRTLAKTPMSARYHHRKSPRSFYHRVGNRERVRWNIDTKRGELLVAAHRQRRSGRDVYAAARTRRAALISSRRSSTPASAKLSAASS